MATQKAQLNQASVLKYMLLPGFLPRFGKLFGGFQNLSYFMAAAFHTLRIIPNGHPCLLKANHGKYSVLQILRIAAGNLTFDRKNIDKVTIFFAVLGGIVIMALQFILGLMALITGTALADDNGTNGGPTTIAQFFANENEKTDLAFRMLDLVFGVPNIFNSSDMATTSFHEGLHALFSFYSYGILLVGAFVIIYLATTIILETAQTGVPFGERFNKAWAPIRLILFFGLLLPAASGLNLAQYLVLQSARLGSNVATNAWIGFDEAVESPYLEESAKLIAAPATPDMMSFAAFMEVAKTCQYAEGRIRGHDIRAWAVYPGKDAIEIGGDSAVTVVDLAQKANGGSILIRFGEKNDDAYPGERGGVKPYCGELTFSIIDQAQPGSVVMQQGYLDLISCSWSQRVGGSSVPDPKEYLSAVTIEPGSKLSCGQIGSQINQRGRVFVEYYSPPADGGQIIQSYVWDAVNAPDKTMALTRHMTEYVDIKAEEAREAQIKDGDWLNDSAIQMGWAGAGIWFNKIAEMNGALTSAIFSRPEVKTMPLVMEHIRKAKMQSDSNIMAETAFTPVLPSGEVLKFNDPNEELIAVPLNQIFLFWNADYNGANIKGMPETYNNSMTGNIIIDVMNTFMGTKGLFDMCKNTDIHPLAQLTSLGKGLLESSIRNFMAAGVIGIGGGLVGMIEQMGFSQVIQAGSSFLMSFAGIGLILGFILYNVVPFMPFVYFFFAVMTWVKSIFEAMVAMPLWALAHLNIGGEGMPGDAAATGYFHLLEIFLRPIAILIGLLGGIAIFAAMVKVMNQIFYLVLSNLAGGYVMGDSGCFQPPGATDTPTFSESDFLGGTIDEFFFTVIYTIIVYLFAVPCFKLVDMIPDHIMTWLGAGISTFGSQDGDPAEGMMQHVSMGAAMAGGHLQQGFGGAMSHASQIFKQQPAE
jgi:conjugal transfer/type IV secretion protein DotA/TraY